MDRHWLLTWTTYGTWLPGDDRGFVGKQLDADGAPFMHNTPGTPYDRHEPLLFRAMEMTLKGPPIYLVLDQASALIDQFLETAGYRQWMVLATAVMRSHVHIVTGVPGDPDPEKLLQSYKSYGSRTLNRKWDRPKSDTWWTESGSKRKLPDDGAIIGAVCYVLDQPAPLATWVHPDFAYLRDPQAREPKRPIRLV